MVVNPVGAVPIFDGGVPRIITATAATGVTGGQFVYFSGGNNVVGSSFDGFNAGSINVIAVASGGAFNGIVITPGNTASGTNNYVAIGLQGTFISTVDGSLVAGRGVTCDGVDSIQTLLSGTAHATIGYDAIIGRALTNGTSGTANYAVWNLTG